MRIQNIINNYGQSCPSKKRAAKTATRFRMLMSAKTARNLIHNLANYKPVVCADDSPSDIV